MTLAECVPTFLQVEAAVMNVLLIAMFVRLLCRYRTPTRRRIDAIVRDAATWSAQ